MEKLNLADVIEYYVDPTEYTYSDIVDNFLFLLEEDHEFIEKELEEKGECIEFSQLNDVCDGSLYYWVLNIKKTETGITADIHSLNTYNEYYPKWNIKSDTFELVHIDEFKNLDELYTYLNELIKE